ncbi:MAG: hypothetical protein JWM25_969 [Thermoleophilia bacterium]|nr:hypothetical protein [Thermoleophilia bacterium]MCZ4496386.1 hypothetical protein [Thermoleophilia bacterium]
MTFESHASADARSARTTHLISTFDGMLGPETLDAFQGVWTTLENAAVDDAAHARAVRERLFWDSLAHAGSLAALPSPAAEELLAPSWDEDLRAA